MPRLGARYAVKFDVISKPKPEYQSDEYFELDLPVAPAVMVGEKIVVEGEDVSEYDVEVEICRQLGLPEPVAAPKGMLSRLFKTS